MVQQNGTYHNGHVNGANVHLPECESDHPIIDIVAKPAPRPSWRDVLAPVTWSMSWLDSSQVSHSVTLRGDTEEEVLEMVKPLVAGIRKAKQVAKPNQAQVADTAVDPDSDIPSCKIHGIPMERRQSKRTGVIYFSHRLPGGERCFGREKKAKF